MTDLQIKTYRLLLTTMVALFVLLSSSSLLAADLGNTGDYQITGFSFDSDAVSESESGLRFESSRFKPLMITNSSSDILAGDPFINDLSAQTSRSAPHGFAVAAEYLATPSLAFHGAIGVTKGNWDADAALQSESSWEANIGVVYNFFNSLAYEVHFGYLDAGDVFKQSDAYSDIDSIIMISNQLTMSF
jgi:hypothetical protein